MALLTFLGNVYKFERKSPCRARSQRGVCGCIKNGTPVYCTKGNLYKRAPELDIPGDHKKWSIWGEK